jgi:hypothetical protein
MTELRDYVDLENPKVRKFAAKQQVAGIELLSPDRTAATYNLPCTAASP